MRFMDLTYLSVPFKVFILVLAMGGFVSAYIVEQYVSVWLSRQVGVVHDWVWPSRKKKRKEYKVWVDLMRL